MAALTVSVIIPAYNEERSIDDVLFRAEKALDALSLPYEVIVVDDGSTDRTRFLAENHKVTVISNGVNYGKGYALRRGLKDATGEVVIMMDADGSHRPEEIKRLIEPLTNGADAVIGSRFASKEGRRSTKKLHVLGNMMFNLLLRVFTGRRITDSQTGFRAFKKRVLEEIQITSDGYAVEIELTVKTLRNGFRVHEEPITFDRRNHGNSHVNPLRDGIRILKTMVQATVKARMQR
ncbi:MAG TPA: glycosyltransferase family 2 protein [Candidatus Bathyarchaeia archaeon]|nr:glycosyltransferase family 2 protein [Candidatus Bathyarchaeia archaeon]